MKRVFIALTNDEVDELGLIDARLEVRRLNQHINALNIERYSATSAAVQAEREACANVAQFEADCLSHEKGTLNPLVAQRGMAKRIAAKIRARGK